MSQSGVAHTSLKTWYNKRGQLEVVLSISQIEQEECHLLVWIEILHFPFGSHWLRLGTCINVKQIAWNSLWIDTNPAWLLMGDLFSPRTWLKFIHCTKKCGDPQMFCDPPPPQTDKTALFTGDRSTNQRRMEIYSYSLMQTKHISSKLIVLYNLKIKEHGLLSR